LKAQGHGVEHVRDLGLRAKPDPIIFQEAQLRQSALVTLNRVDFELLVTAWNAWGLGSHHGVITPRRGRQPTPGELVQQLDMLLSRVPSIMNQVVYL
jgi:hypothetical protein